jgi:hypothetical protein
MLRSEPEKGEMWRFLIVTVTSHGHRDGHGPGLPATVHLHGQARITDDHDPTGPGRDSDGGTAWQARKRPGLGSDPGT